MVRFLAQALLICVVFIAALRAGGKPERHVASIYFAMLLASTADALLGGGETAADYAGLHVFRFTLDCCALAGIVFVALRYERWWTLWVGSVQLIAVMAHVLRAIAVPMPALVYVIMERWPVWMAVLITAAGTFLHHRRQQAVVSDI
ncbi:hypothetical protein OIK40_14975 [Erythrobacter sp. sf7]|uniref:Rod shape-determining protein MreD n=2 Tax=Erythrobacter fulvus TaxID=2987523 RepID=A0ABT5JT98_9SPHN|nr:hypothetical protein [Erythrobacter fulvus]